MKILAIGDVIGKPGRDILASLIDSIRVKSGAHFVICNGENAAGGFGITEKIFRYLHKNLAIDCITTGNHWADKREVYDFIDTTPSLLVPANMGNVAREESGIYLTQVSHHSVAVINLTGRVFMHPDNRCPFKTADRLLAQLSPQVKIRIVDFHGEATSEKQALASYLVGKVSLFYGTHTHVPTADERILDSYTGYTTDIGMTGPYDSIIGMKKEGAIHRFLTGEKKRLEPASGDLWLPYIVAEIDESTGRCVAISRFQKRLEIDDQ